MDHLRRNMEGSGTAEGDLHCRGPAQGVTEENFSMFIESVLVILWQRI